MDKYPVWFLISIDCSLKVTKELCGMYLPRISGTSGRAMTGQMTIEHYVFGHGKAKRDHYDARSVSIIYSMLFTDRLAGFTSIRR